MLTFEDRAAEVLRRSALHLKAAATPPSSARFSAPLGDLHSARLVFPGGAAHLRIHAADAGTEPEKKGGCGIGHDRSARSGAWLTLAAGLLAFAVRRRSRR